MNTYLKIVITLVLGIGASILFYKVIQKGFSGFHRHKVARVQEIFKDTAFNDVIYVGSSRTHTTIYPSVVDSITGMTSYNAGVEGGNLFEFKMTLEGYLASHPAPGLLVLTIDPKSFDLSRKIFFPIQYFDVVDNPAVRESFRELKDYKRFFIKHLPFLRVIYFDEITKIQSVKGLFGDNEFVQLNLFQDKGFLSNGYKCAEDSEYYKSESISITDEGRVKLQEMIGICKTKGIDIMLVFAPEFDFKYQSIFSNFNEFIGVVDSFAKNNNIPFYRDDSLGMRSNRCYFANYGHVNTYGAIEYSKILGKRVLAWKNQNNK